MKSKSTLRIERRYPRRAFAQKIGVLCAGKYFLSEGRELGEGGIRFFTDRVLEVGNSVLATFHVPGGGFVFAPGTVNTSEKDEAGLGFSVGLSFDGLDFSRRRQIRLYVSGRSR